MKTNLNSQRGVSGIEYATLLFFLCLSTVLCLTEAGYAAQTKFNYIGSAFVPSSDSTSGSDGGGDDSASGGGSESSNDDGVTDEIE